MDWAGDPLYVTNNITGEAMKAYLFVASLPCSLYGYAEAFPDMKSNHWIEAHIHAYKYFGGVLFRTTLRQASLKTREPN